MFLEWRTAFAYFSLGFQISLINTFVKGDSLSNVINLKRLLNGKQNVWKYQNGEEKSDSDGREKDV